MKYILLLDSCIKSSNYNLNRIKQYENGLNSILKYTEFFLKNNIDIVFVDNSVDNLDEYPNIKEKLPKCVKIICKKLNINGPNKAGGVFEHWLLSKDIWKNYDYLIHFEIRQILNSKKFFEEFLLEPVSIFGWGSKHRLIKNLFPYGKFIKKDIRFEINKYNRYNTNYNVNNFNDFYTGLMSLEVKHFLSFVENYDLKNINKFCSKTGPKSLEKIIMCFAYDNLENFKVIERLDVKRYSYYDNLKKFDPIY